LVHQYKEEEINGTKELVEYVVLYHANNEGTLNADNVVAQVSDEHEFAKSVHDYLVLWCAVLSKYADLRESTEEDLNNAAVLLERAEASNVEAVQSKAKIDKRYADMQQQWERLKDDL
jgi:hypothetical protein